MARDASACAGHRPCDTTRTHNDNHVGVAGLHLGCWACVFISNEVLSINDGDDSVEFELAICLPLELTDLEGERRGKGRASGPRL